MLSRPLPPARFGPVDEMAAAAGGSATWRPAVEAGLDAEALRKLRDLDPTGANRLLERVFAAFESSTARLMAQLREAHRTGDSAGVRHVAHTLKSSSASIGAVKLSQLCAEIESMIRKDTAEGLPERIEQMDHEAQAVLQALRQSPGRGS